MALSHFPRTVTNGLVLCLDAANPKSYGDTTENLFSYSQDLSNAVWAKNNSTVSVDSTAAPDGTVTAEKLIIDNTITPGNIVRSLGSLSATTAYTESVYLKVGEWNYAFVWLNDGSGNGYVVEINLTTGANRTTRNAPSGRYTNFSYNVTTAANGWYRVEMTATTASALNFQMRVYPSNIAWTTGSFGSEYPAGDGTSGIYIWGFQIEHGPIANEYYANLGAATKSRGTDWKDLSGNGNDGTLVSGLYSSVDSGSLIFDGVDDNVTLPDIPNIRLADVSFEFWFKLDDVSADSDLLNKGFHNTNQPLLIWFDRTVGADTYIGNSSCISVYSYDGVTGHWVATNSNTIVADTYYHLVVVFEPSYNKTTIYLNGNLAQSNTKTWNGIQNSNNNFKLCSGGLGESPLDGNMNLFKIYDRAVTPSEISQNFEAIRSRFGI